MKTDDPTAEISYAINAIKIVSGLEFFILEKRFTIDQDASTFGYRRGSRRGEAPPLFQALEDTIYTRLYTRDLTDRSANLSSTAVRDAVIALSDSNCGGGHWDSDWIVTSKADDSHYWVEKYGARFWVCSTQLKQDKCSIEVGKPCLVRIAKEQRQLSPGFYIAIGDAEDSRHDQERLVRIYWHLMPAGAVPFISELTMLWNKAGIPFRAKVLSNPEQFTRADAAVIYVRQHEISKHSEMLSYLYEKVEQHLMPTVPLFTKMLAPGLSLAEDPDNNLSFGESVSRILAASAIECFNAGIEDRNERLEFTRKMFINLYLNPDRPYLAPYSTNEYDSLEIFPKSIALPPLNRTGSERELKQDKAKSILIDAATRIGSLICQQAIWDGEARYCNFVGRAATPESAPTISEVMGADLYSGASGIALMLGDLYEVTGEKRYLDTALGALRCALLRTERNVDRLRPLSFYSGHLGIAYVCWRLSRFSSADEIQRGMHTCLRAATDLSAQEHIFDIIGGSAGAIPVLIRLARGLQLKELAEKAKTLGLELCKRAIWSEQFCTWDGKLCTGGEFAAPLAGFAHGASGIALSLLELFRYSGDAEFLKVARGSFAYEDTLFSKAKSNWADARFNVPVTREIDRADFVSAWCHGAPGIALARLRASVLDEENSSFHLQRAKVAFDTTAATLQRLIQIPSSDTSLCHGTAGLAEILNIGGTLLGEPHIAASLSAGSTLAERYSITHVLSSGLPNRAPNSSFMLGSAGVAHCFLRLARPDQISPILRFDPYGG